LIELGTQRHQVELEWPHGAVRRSSKDLGATVAHRLLAMFFLGVGLVKLWAGHQPRFDIGPTWFYVLAVAELLTGMALLTRHRRAGAYSALLLSIGIVVAALSRPSGDCGCLGGMVEINATQRLLLGSIAGLLSCIACWLRISADSGTPSKELYP